MTCPRCEAKLIPTKIGKLCLDCGFVSDPVEVTATLITPHTELVHLEHRLKNPEEPGLGQVEDITDVTAFTAESNSTLGAFTWVQVAVSRFSYYAVVFILVIIMSGLSYGLFFRKNETAHRECNSDVSQTSSESVSAYQNKTPEASPVCK